MKKNEAKVSKIKRGEQIQLLIIPKVFLTHPTLCVCLKFYHLLVIITQN